MGNPFDQFDVQTAQSTAMGTNPFDQFDGQDSGAGMSALQGFNATVPFGNRMTAGMGALMAAPFSQDSVSSLYDQARSNQRVTEQAHPNANLAGSLGGLAVTLPAALLVGGESSLPVIGKLADAAKGTNKALGDFVGRGSNLLSRAARSSIVAAPVGATYGYGQGEEGNRIESAVQGAGMAAGVGGALPLAGAAIGAGSKAVGGALNRLGSLLGNEKSQSNIADNIIAKRLIAEGYTPEEIQKLISEGRASGLTPTLGEATQSSGILQAEKSILRGTGEGANQMREALNVRNRDTVPNTISSFAKDLEGKAGNVSGIYQAASKEASDKANLAQNVLKNRELQKTTTLGDVEGLNAGANTVTAISNSIANRIGQLGDVSNVESRALNQAKKIVDNAGKRDNSFDALLDAKKQLDNLYIEGADATVQKQANRYVSDYSKQINDSLKKLSPDVYPYALKAAKTDMAAQDIKEALSSTNEGSLATLYNKVWAKPELRQDFLRKLPDEETRQQATNLFTQLENIKRGFGGSDTAFNLPANQELAKDAGLGVDAELFNPLKSASAFMKGLGGKATPGVYKKIAEQSLNPDVGRITSAMEKASGSKLLGNAAPYGAGAEILNKPHEPLKVNNWTDYSAPSAPAQVVGPQSQAQPDQQQPQSDLFAKVIQTESGGNQKAISPKGAIGIAQIMPKTAREAAEAAGLPYDPIKFRTDANYNAALGQAYLSKLQSKYNGNDTLALMAYNWGQGNVDMWMRSGAKLERIPDETKNYLQKILG